MFALNGARVSPRIKKTKLKAAISFGNKATTKKELNKKSEYPEKRNFSLLLEKIFLLRYFSFKVGIKNLAKSKTKLIKSKTAKITNINVFDNQINPSGKINENNLR